MLCCAPQVRSSRGSLQHADKVVKRIAASNVRVHCERDRLTSCVLCARKRAPLVSLHSLFNPDCLHKLAHSHTCPSGRRTRSSLHTRCKRYRRSLPPSLSHAQVNTLSVHSFNSKNQRPPMMMMMMIATNVCSSTMYATLHMRRSHNECASVCVRARVCVAANAGPSANVLWQRFTIGDRHRVW